MTGKGSGGHISECDIHSNEDRDIFVSEEAQPRFEVRAPPDGGRSTSALPLRVEGGCSEGLWVWRGGMGVLEGVQPPRRRSLRGSIAPLGRPREGGRGGLP